MQRPFLYFFKGNDFTCKMTCGKNKATVCLTLMQLIPKFGQIHSFRARKNQSGLIIQTDSTENFNLKQTFLSPHPMYSC